MRTVALSAFTGTALEWYDFGLYGWASALVFQQLFFVTDDPFLSMLGSFGSFAVGFFARPLGSIIFGHMGDRTGRKSMLIMTLGLMGVATFLIGLLPTFETAGAWAIILLTLLRIVQGIAVGGEFGGAALITAEHAPRRQRGFWTSSTAAGAPAGLLLSSGVFFLFSALPEDQFLTWGWRVPFLLSAVVLAVGMLIRLRVQETPLFKALEDAPKADHIPIVELLKNHKSILFRAVGARLVDAAAANVFTVFAVSFIVSTTGASPGLSLGAGAAANAVHLVLIPVAAALSDRIGRRPLVITGAVVMGLMAGPGFMLMSTGNDALIILGVIVAWPLASVLIIGPTPAMLAELFPTHIRASGTSFVYQLQTLIAGVTPLIATALLMAGGGQPWLIVAYIALLAVITASCAASLPEVAGRDLNQDLPSRRGRSTVPATNR
ncbi:shikimate transporter [Arthrobacter crystallopoietes BAB-32]|uniref:Shikimate transporter n=2 Tax=Crystallibacter crystallopoietes TaxID=37928 RepID=N1V9E2_9MICC|nr:shikimate transporter [Arthrobacter crystallopoietes BAB-32]